MKKIKIAIITSILVTSVNAEYLIKKGFGNGISFTEEQSNGIITDSLLIQLDASDINSNNGGTSWNDLSGNNNHFTLINGATKINNYIHFDGNNDYAIKTTNPTSFNYNRTNFTMDIWYRRHSAVDQTWDFSIMSKWDSGARASNEFAISDDSSKAYFYVDVDDGLSPNTGGAASSEYIGLANNTWRHIVGTFDNGIVKLYINGIQVASGSHLTQTAATNNFPLVIATFNNGSGYYTDIDVSKIKFYNKTLSDSDVVHNFNADKGEFGL